jgi:hypothetical protein
MKKIYFILIFALAQNIGFAQKSKQEKKEARNQKINALIKQNEEGLIVYKKTNNFGIHISTEGYHAFFEKGIRESRRITKLLKIELAEKRHLREQKSSIAGSIISTGSSYIYAKLNNVYQLNFGYGVQYLIGSKGNMNGIEVSAVGTAGLSLNFEKPYYFDVVQDATNERKRITFNTDTGGTYKIIGASGFSYGWKELKINPGAFAKAGLRFEYGRETEKVNALDVGLFTEFFSKKVPQVYGLKQKQLFFGAYIGLVFGKRK